MNYTTKYNLFIVITIYSLFCYAKCSINNCLQSETKRIKVGESCYTKCVKKILRHCKKYGTFCDDIYSNIEVCKKCNNGYVLLIETSCVKGIDHCSAYEELKIPLKCTKCECDFILLSNECIRKIEGCLEYSETTNLCDKCDSNYVLYENTHKCLRKKKHCESHYIDDDKGKIYCRKCELDYILNDSTGVCYNNVPKCDKCSRDENSERNSLIICENTIPNQKSDCLHYHLTTEEKIDGQDTCCYVTYKDEYNNNIKGCSYLNKKIVSEIMIEFNSESYGIYDLTIDCHSNWLTSGFALLLLILF